MIVFVCVCVCARAQKVCENLLRRGPVTLQLLIRSTELTPLQVKNSLLILIQHNCVQSFSCEQIGIEIET